MATTGDRPMDQHTINLLNSVTNQINTQNQKLVTNSIPGSWQTAYQSNAISNLPLTTIQPILDDKAVEVALSPNIDMESEIYKNEFEECGSVDIGKPSSDYGSSPLEFVYIGLIDEISEDEDDLYAKLTDGEIVPFNGHKEKITITFDTWNDLKRSDLIGSEVKKAATCRIMINDRLARIIEGTEVQDLLMKADRAIDELKVMPFSICRDALTLIGREIYYDNQPAIINNVDEIDNYIYIVPDSNYLTNFVPPPHVLEDDDSDEWTTNFGQGMLIRDYDEKIWWWRNTKGANIDPNDDPYYKQFPQPVPPPTPIHLTPMPPMTPYNPYGVDGTTSSPNTITWSTPYTTLPTITWTATGTTIPDATGDIGINPSNGDMYVYTNLGTHVTTITDPVNDTTNITAKEMVEMTTPEDLNKMITKNIVEPINKNYYNKYKTKKFSRKAVAYKVGEKSPYTDKEYNAELAKCPDCLLENGIHLIECTGG